MVVWFVGKLISFVFRCLFVQCGSESAFFKKKKTSVESNFLRMDDNTSKYRLFLGVKGTNYPSGGARISI